jgi:hypothetical protein
MDARVVPGTQLARYDAICRVIDSAYEVNEVKEIRDKAMALEVYMRQIGNTESEDQCYQIRMRAQRKAGELVKAMEKAKRGPDAGGQGSQRVTSEAFHEEVVRLSHKPPPKTLAELGISKQQSSDWRKLAIAAGKVVPVSGDALLFIGSMRDFERRGIAGTLRALRSRDAPAGSQNC